LAAFAAQWLYYRDTVYFCRPVEYADDVRIRNDDYGDGHFGARRKGGRSHKGVDLLGKVGDPVKASKGGWGQIGQDKNGFGNYVIIHHSGKLATLYAHLSEVFVKGGGRVRQGDVIGAIGKTGNAGYDGMESHLHFEVKIDGESVDPMPRLRKAVLQ